MSRPSMGRSGRCYELACQRLLDGSVADGLVLVHGYPTLTAGEHEGSRYGHAWLEWAQPVPPLDDRTRAALGDQAEALHQALQAAAWVVWDPVQDMEVPRSLYYAVGRIEPHLCHRYTPAQARAVVLEWGHWGPWHTPPPDALFGAG